MKFIETLKLALSAVWAHKLRSALTLLGMVIGVASVVIVVSLIPIDWPGLKWPIFKPLIRCGQQSLPVFCVGLFLSFIAHFVIQFGSEGVLAQLVVGAAGLSIMTIIAYYRTWSKDIDKSLSSGGKLAQ